MTDPTPSPPSGEHRFPGPGTLDRALELVRFLRANCPWDAKQTAESLVPHLLEETHEVVDAIQTGDDQGLPGELGDLLLNLAFQIVVAEERSVLDADSVYGALEKKMVSRHPHLFGDGEREDWETLKARERPEGQSVLEGIAKGLDPVTKAHRVQERAAAVGFDWDSYVGALEKVAEELGEVREVLELGAADTHRDVDVSNEGARGSQLHEALIEELGDLMFSVVNLSRLTSVHATTALARANEKFMARFHRLETLAAERGIVLGEVGLEVLDGLWDELKAQGG